MSRCLAQQRVVLFLLSLIVSLSSPALAHEEDDAADGPVLEKLAELEAKIDQLERLIRQLLTSEGTTPPQSRAITSPAAQDFSATPVSRSADTLVWRTFAFGWEYRNATFQASGGPYAFFVVEMRRTGAPVAGAMFTVTLYDEDERIVGTAGATLLTVQRGEIKTAEFLMQDFEPNRVKGYRLQSDMEF